MRVRRGLGSSWCVLATVLSLSGCFLAGYDTRPIDGDASALVDDGAVEPSDADIDDDDASGPRPDASRDAAVDAGPRDAQPPVDAALAVDAAHDADASKPRAPDAEAGTESRDAATEGGADPVPDASNFADAGDATVDIDASDASDATIGAGLDAAGDAATDAGDAALMADACGPSGCVVRQTCASPECDLVCAEVPDPGSDPTLDCTFQCADANRCSTVCTSGNTCQTGCTGANVCRSTCPFNSTCLTTCDNVRNCGGTCQTGSQCLFTCSASGCNQIACALGAACRIKCLSGTCDFGFCGNVLIQSCLDGSIVCGRLCP